MIRTASSRSLPKKRSSVCTTNSIGVLSSFTRRTRYTRSSLLFHDALQRMLVLASVIHDLGHLGLGDLEGVHATLPDAVLVNVEHDPRRLLSSLLEEPLQDLNHELHRGVVVVEQKHAVEARPFRLGPRLGDDARPGIAVFDVGATNRITHADRACLLSEF